MQQTRKQYDFMLRQDFAMALGQADQLGNTLLQNRMMKQQQSNRVEDNAMRERMFTEQQGLRQDANTRQLNKQKLDEEQAYFGAAYKSVMGNPDITDEEIESHNKKLASFEYLGGMRVARPVPKKPGQFNTAPGRNLEILTQLRERVKSATTPEGRAEANQQLADFQSFTGKKQEIDPRLSAAKKAAIDAELSGDVGAMERAQNIINQVTPKETVSVMGDVRKRDEELMRETSQPARSAAKGKPLDAATAAEFLKEARGSKKEARKLAAERGYSF